MKGFVGKVVGFAIMSVLADITINFGSKLIGFDPREIGK